MFEGITRICQQTKSVLSHASVFEEEKIENTVKRAGLSKRKGKQPCIVCQKQRCKYPGNGTVDKCRNKFGGSATMERRLV